MHVKGSGQSIHVSVVDAEAPARKQQHLVDPAAAAGKTKVDFYDAVKWLVGYDGVDGKYVAPKNELPHPLEKAFVRGPKHEVLTDEYGYDESKFLIDAYPDSDNPDMRNSRVEITSKLLRSHKMESVVAGVEFQNNEFVVRLVHKPRTGVYPFSKEDLLRAVTSAKWELELFCLPDSGDSESDAESASSSRFSQASDLTQKNGSGALSVLDPPRT